MNIPEIGPSIKPYNLIILNGCWKCDVNEPIHADGKNTVNVRVRNVPLVYSIINAVRWVLLYQTITD